MQSAVIAEQKRRFWSPSTTPSGRDSKFMVASVALAGAAVLSVPVAVDPAVSTSRAVAEYAVELSAFQNPFTAWQNVISTGATNLRDRTEDIFSRGLPALLASAPGLQEDVSDVIRNLLTDPAAGRALVESLPGYAEVVRSAISDTPAAIQGQLDLFPAAWAEATAKLEAGDIFGFVHRLDVYAVYALRALGPIRTILTIPGNVAADLGSPDLKRVLDGILTGRVVSGYAESALSPLVGAVFAATEVFESVVDAAKAGDVETLVSELINAPAKVTGAFFNGIQLKYFPAEERYYMPGLLSAGGPIDRFLVGIPEALKELVNPTPTSPTTAELSKVSSSDIGASGDVVTLALGTGDAETPTDVDTAGVSSDGGDGSAAVTPAVDDSTEGSTEETEGSTEETEASTEETDEVTDGATDEGSTEETDEVTDEVADSATDEGSTDSDEGSTDSETAGSDNESSDTSADTGGGDE